MRPLFVLLHRWFGLSAALFLFIAGLTGALISWDHEIDAWLNPDFYFTHNPETALATRSGLELAKLVEAQNPRLRVSYVLTENIPGHTSVMMVQGRNDQATGQPVALEFNQIAVDPATGAIQAKRLWGALSLQRENLLPFLYKLHYTMFMPSVYGIDTGIWLMGIIGLLWTCDCLIALYLSFPHWRSWRKSFALRWQQGGYKRLFDLHRSGGVWLWILLLVLSVSSVSMNLERPVVRPILQLFSTLAPDVVESRTGQSDSDAEPHITREQVVKLAADQARQHNWNTPVGGVFYSAELNLYGVGLFAHGNDHGDSGLGNSWLYFDATTGQPAGQKIPGQGSAGDLFLQAQFPLHSGRIIGIPGRIIISLLGLVVAALSLTGALLWLRKRHARQRNKIPGNPF